MDSRSDFDFDSDFSPRNLFDSFYLPNEVFIVITLKNAIN